LKRLEDKRVTLVHMMRESSVRMHRERQIPGQKNPGGPVSQVFSQPRDEAVTYEALFATAGL
jgi:hypothetical protein